MLEHFLLEKNLSGATKIKDIKMSKEDLAKTLLEARSYYH
jgi:hypothetical protein